LDINKKPYRVVRPRFAIANGAVFGEAPIELTELNDVELALVSKARTNKHVFAFYGGAHKCMRGWHTLYENDVEGIAHTLHQVPHYSGDGLILCILIRPFTPLQKRFMKHNMMVRPYKVLNALTWLKQNNVLYHDITIPQANDLPPPIIIDKSDIIASEDTNIEGRMEYTVIFMETDNILPMNGGCLSQDAFMREVINAMDSTSSSKVISRPTPIRMLDYKGNALLCAFPLQFPYGIRLPPPQDSNRRDGKQALMSQLDYLQHLQHLW
jgi:hypothetical protein